MILRGKRRVWSHRLHSFLSLPVECGLGGSTWRFALLSVAVHVALFAAIFDIYFTSPLVTGISKRFQAPLPKPPASRLVLIVSDGLRAHTLFDQGMQRTPFLRKVALEKGSWGVSHTRVPTESRPGHVALIAGFYEDVASVARGWRENAVEFDSIFNRSSGTWAWGSPDVVPMFGRGTTPGVVRAQTYSSELEDFARGDNAANLDAWVLNRTTDFLKRTSDHDWALAERLRRGEGFVFFLHLLGMDTSGHGDKPGSKTFQKTLAAMDRTVQALESAFEAFFHKDRRTAFLLTSDHGMTDWGSHGAGHDHETLTPLLAWGAGVQGPQERSGATFAQDWPIPRRRIDVDQADVCALMAALLNLEFPANSVGRLPLNFLNVTTAEAALLTRANALQMLEQFRIKRRRVKEASLVAFFKESPYLSPSKIEERLRQAAHAEISGSLTLIIEIFEQLRQDALDGLYYFHRYDRLFSGLCVSAIFLLWIVALLLSTSARLGCSFPAELSGLELAAFGLLLAGQSAVLALEGRPPLHWLYRLGPVLLAWGLWRQRHLASSAHLSFRGFLDGLVVLWGLELLVWCFFYRLLLTLVVLLNTAWVIALYWRPSLALTTFALASGILAVFPMFPVISGFLMPALVALGSLFSAAVLLLLTQSFLQPPRTIRRVLHAQAGLLVWACLSHLLTHASIHAGHGLHLVLQISNWLTAAACPVLFCIIRRAEVGPDVTLLSLGAAIATVYCLLSVFYETLFFLALGISVRAWVALERSGGKETHSQLLRRCFTFTLFLVLSFFGTGNIASINSFDPQSVYCFLTVFQPFLMGALMLLKVVLPMLYVSCLFAHLVTDVPITQLSRVTMILADFMALHFFFLIRDWGSWLEIGTSISHYVISMAFTVIVAVFLAIARLLLPVDREALMKES